MNQNQSCRVRYVAKDITGKEIEDSHILLHLGVVQSVNDYNVMLKHLQDDVLTPRMQILARVIEYKNLLS